MGLFMFESNHVLIRFGEEYDRKYNGDVDAQK